MQPLQAMNQPVERTVEPRADEHTEAGSGATSLEPANVPEPRWRARLSLEYRCRGEQTFLWRRRHHGPLYVQRPFYEPNGTCQTYLLHPPGGIVGGDDMGIDVLAAEQTRVLITSPGAVKFYRSTGALSTQTQRLKVETDAELEWLPHETIVFEGAVAQSRTLVELSKGARFAGWEIVCLGRPASGEGFEAGRFAQSFELSVDGEPIWLERGRYCAGEPALTEPWGLGGHRIFGSLVHYPATANELTKLRTLLAQRQAAAQVTATLLDDVLVCRYLGDSTFYAKQIFTEVWSMLRPLTMAKPAHAPRIWAT